MSLQQAHSCAAVFDLALGAAVGACPHMAIERVRRAIRTLVFIGNPFPWLRISGPWPARAAHVAAGVAGAFAPQAALDPQIGLLVEHGTRMRQSGRDTRGPMLGA